MPDRMTDEQWERGLEAMDAYDGPEMARNRVALALFRKEAKRARDGEEWFRKQWLKEQAFRAEIEARKDAEIGRLRGALKQIQNEAHERGIAWVQRVAKAALEDET